MTSAKPKTNKVAVEQPCWFVTHFVFAFGIHPGR